MALDLGSFEKALDAHSRSLNAIRDGNVASLSDNHREAIRAGVIQNFKVAYEQCWKFIQRWLRENYSPEAANHPRTRKEIFRIAARVGLIADPLPWFAYGDARNLTSHTYDAKLAEIVYQAAEKFGDDAKTLLNKLRELND